MPTLPALGDERTASGGTVTGITNGSILGSAEADLRESMQVDAPSAPSLFEQRMGNGATAWAGHHQRRAGKFRFDPREFIRAARGDLQRP
jgi:hypothetical protein